MIIINQGALNEINITVSQVALAGNYYQMVFTSTYSPGNTYTIFPYIVSTNSRFTCFGIDCTQAEPNPYDGAVNFVPTGSYNYSLNITETLGLTATVLSTILMDTATVNSCNESSNIYNFITVDGQL